MCGGDIEVGSDLVLVKRASCMNEQRHGACLTDQEKAKRRSDARRRARAARRAFRLEMHTVRLTGSQLEEILAGLPDGPESAAIRSACTEALVEIREKLAARAR
jgi:hypothetical protein